MSNMVKKDRTAKYLIDYIKTPEKMYSGTLMPAYELSKNQLEDLSAFLLALDFSKYSPKVVPVEQILGKDKKGGTCNTASDAK